MVLVHIYMYLGFELFLKAKNQIFEKKVQCVKSWDKRGIEASSGCCQALSAHKTIRSKLGKTDERKEEGEHQSSAINKQQHLRARVLQSVLVSSSKNEFTLQVK